MRPLLTQRCVVEIVVGDGSREVTALRLRHLIASLAVGGVAWVGYEFYAAHAFGPRFSKIEFGVSRDQVVGFIGRPDEIKTGDCSYYIDPPIGCSSAYEYDWILRGSAAVVFFNKDGKVISAVEYH